MHVSSLILISAVMLSCNVKQIEDGTSFNGIALGAPRQDFLQDFHFYTGEEPFYMEYPTIKESLLRNIENGIREGVYEGEDLLGFGEWQAHGLKLTFYQEELHKAQWTFKALEGADVPKIAASINAKLEGKYGPGKKESFPEFTIIIWHGNTFRLQSFQENDLEFTIEFSGTTQIDN